MKRIRKWWNKRKSNTTRRIVFVPYSSWDKYRWFVRFNIVLMPEYRCLERSTGLIGVGFVWQLYYGRARTIGSQKQVLKTGGEASSVKSQSIDKPKAI